MLSHHAPPRRLLQNFVESRTKRDAGLWVYSRGRKARPVWKVTAESAEHGYFSGDPHGRTEEEIDRELNEKYEAPFNRLLPALTNGLAVALDKSLVEVCSNYMAGIFLRSKPRREASRAHSRAFSVEVLRRLEDPLTLRQYAAKISLATQGPVALQAVMDASRQFLDRDGDNESPFFQSATTNYSQLPAFLKASHWSICSSPHLELLQSDAAIALLNVDTRGVIRYGTGVAKAGSQWILPLSSKVALRASAEYVPSNVLTFQQANVLNEYMIRAAHSFVYSSKYAPIVESFTNENLYTLHFFRDMLISNVYAEVDQMLGDLRS